MSYGEPTLLPDYGRFIDLVNEVPILNMVIEADDSDFTLNFLYNHNFWSSHSILFNFNQCEYFKSLMVGGKQVPVNIREQCW